MNERIIEMHASRGWILHPPGGEASSIGPRYRGSFEPGDAAPRRIRVIPEGTDSGAAARFLSPRTLPLLRRRAFGISVEIPPEEWAPAGTRRGWHFFRREKAMLGIWSSLPATWLAQDAAGTPLEPPWRELWTFGADHTWICRLGTGEGEGAFGIFAESCLSGCWAG